MNFSCESKQHVMILAVVALLFTLLTLKASGQVTQDTTVKLPDIATDTIDNYDILKKHSPRKATIYSMILPGLGQGYNKKYWKIPIVYAGFGVFYYFVRFNNNLYQQYKAAYYHSLVNTDNTEPPVNDLEVKYDSQTLLDAKDYYRRNRDLSYILSAVWYVLNVIDAAVDAHLYSWNVDENLSLKIEPQFMTPEQLGYKPAGGLKLTLRF